MLPPIFAVYDMVSVSLCGFRKARHSHVTLVQQLTGKTLMALPIHWKSLERLQRFLKENNLPSMSTFVKMQGKDGKSRSQASKTANTGNRNNENIVKQGYLKKQKTMRKKYFVLYGDSPEAPARLEYYDSEKRFKANNQPPKRSIILKNCFNINKQTPSTGRRKYVIALFTRGDHFNIVFETENEMELWLKLLLELQWGEDIPEGRPIRPNFEHVWPIRILEKALGAKNGIIGPHLLCLTDEAVSLVKTKEDGSNHAIIISLIKIRRCGNFDTFFYMEVGHGTVTGAGHLWMETEDPHIAFNMHATILKNCYQINPNFKMNKLTVNQVLSSPLADPWKPLSFKKYPPAAESSADGEDPLWSQRILVHPLSSDPPVRSLSTGNRPSKTMSSPPQTCSGSGVRERSDSMPTRSRKNSDSLLSHLTRPRKALSSVCQVCSPGKFPHLSNGNGATDEVRNSPPSGACSSDSAGSSLSIEGDTVDGHWDDSNRFGRPHTPDGDGEVILEENDYAAWQAEDEQLNNYMRSDLSCDFAHSSTGSVYRKISPNPMSTCFISASPGKGSYKDIYSPIGTSPAEVSQYMAMSPGEHRTLTTSKPSVISHSRGSSITEEGYVPMAPGSKKDEYVDMDHGTNYYKSDRYQSGDLSRTESSSSNISGTPSTDHRFIDYPLDKVNSYFPADEEINPAERPTRAYSVGSRPNSFNKRTEIPPVTPCERTRAFSVGSRSGKCGFNQLRVALNNSHALSSSHSSVEPSEDMMEMDFSKKGRSMRQKKKVTSSERLSVPAGSASTLSSAASSYSTAEGSYMEMSPRTTSPSLIPSPPKGSRLLAAFSKSPPKHNVHEYLQDMQPLFKNSPPVTIGYPSPSLGRVPEGEPGYMEMSSSDSGELKAAAQYVVHPPSSDMKDKDSYVEMKPGCIGEAKHIIAKNVKARIDSFPETAHPTGTRSYSSSYGNKLTKEEAKEAFFRRKLPLIEDNNNTEYSPSGRNACADEYVEMNMSRNTPLGKSPEETDYMNMSITPSRRDSNRSASKPISIQSCAKELPESSGYLIGPRKSSATPPKVPSYLPLASSLSPSSSSLEHRARARKHSERRNSKESTGSITTPIFPFSLNSPANSPGSYESASKCPVDASSGTVRLSYHADSASEEDLSKTAIFEVVSVDEDYLNYEPDILSGAASPFTAEAVPSSGTTNASVPSRKSSAPVFGSKLRPFEKLLSGLGSSFSSLSLGSSQHASTSKSDTQISSARNDVSSSVGDDVITPEDDERKAKKESVAKKTSDVRSEKKLHYASLDLARTASELGDDWGKASSSIRAQSSLTDSSSGSTSSPNTTIEASEFRYAEIDFAKSSRSSISSCSSGSSCHHQKSAPP